MTRLQTIVHPVKKEFGREKCGFEHKPADAFVKSQWQNCSKSIPYLIYRWVIAFFFTIVVIESLIDPDDPSNFWLYFIYLTNWGIILCMITNLYIAILVTIWHFHPEYEEKLMNLEKLTNPFRIYWALHIISLVVSIVITIIYWTILYDAVESSLSATNILTHACNSIFMFIDLLIVSHPIRLLHMFLPVAFGLTYAVFSIIYQKLGGLNKRGKPYIYFVIDWSKPQSASVTVIGVLMLSCFVYMILFTIYKLRSLLYKRLNAASFFLPTTVNRKTASNSTVKCQNCCQDDDRTSGVQHSSSRISMVLSDYAGYQNKAYNISTENISK